jgi:hypothetical protein
VVLNDYLLKIRPTNRMFVADCSTGGADQEGSLILNKYEFLVLQKS